jgi:hypothetical protein
VTNLSGEETGFDVVAFTLSAGLQGPELHAALRNDRDVSACDGAASFELFDQQGVSLGSWIGGLFSETLFRRSDGMGGLVACIEPGGIALVALPDLPHDLPLEQVGTALYQLNYFDRSILPFELVEVDAIGVTGVAVVEQDDGSVFTGTLENGLEVPMGAAAVTIFALSAVGRPLGSASTTSSADLAAGESWIFETAPLVDAGEDYAAFPSGSVSF